MPLTNVTSSVRTTVLLFLGLVACACNGPDPATKVGGFDKPKVSTDVTEDPNAGKPLKNPGKAHKPPGGKVPEIKFSPEVFRVVQPGSGDWGKSKKSAVEVGDAIDKALQNPVPAIALADTNFDVGGATLTGKSTVKIKDAKTYWVEFYTPESRATLNRIVSDGKHKAHFLEEKWSEPAAPTIPSGATPPESALKDWPKTFMRDMFSAYDTGRAVWGPLTRYWQKSGYEILVEQRAAKMKDGRPYYRIVATAKDGSQCEVHVDGMRNLPILVRTVVKTADGKSDKRMWSAAWKFGGKFEEKDFLLPVVSAPKGP